MKITLETGKPEITKFPNGELLVRFEKTENEVDDVINAMLNLLTFMMENEHPVVPDEWDEEAENDEETEFLK